MSSRNFDGMYDELGLNPKAGMYMSASSCSPFESLSVIPPSGVGDEETTFARYLIETWRERSAAVARWVINSGF